MRPARRGAIVLVMLAAGSVSCVGATPSIAHYDLPVPATAAPARVSSEAPVIAVERFTAAAPYDGAEIALRSAPARLDYYRYHRWIAPAPDLVTELIATSWDASGRFARVDCDGGLDPDVTLVVAGRVRILEVDAAGRARPHVRVALELTGRDSRGEVVYRRVLARRVRIADRSVDSVVAAMHRGVQAIAREAAPGIESAARAARLLSNREATSTCGVPSEP